MLSAGDHFLHDTGDVAVSSTLSGCLTIIHIQQQAIVHEYLYNGVHDLFYWYVVQKLLHPNLDGRKVVVFIVWWSYSQIHRIGNQSLGFES